jgi:hypothetical protein
MKTDYYNLSFKSFLPQVTRITLTVLLATLPLRAYAVTLVTERNDLQGNDSLDWSNIPPSERLPIMFPPQGNSVPILLENSFTAFSEGGLPVEVVIPEPFIPSPPPLPLFPLFFQTRADGIPTNYAEGDFVLFTGFNNPGPLTLTFNTPVFGAGTQVTVDDVFEFDIFLEVFDSKDNLLDSFTVAGTSSLELDNSAQFVGVISNTANISKLVYRSDEMDFALGINALSLLTTPTPVPEPLTTLDLFIALGFGILFKKKLSDKTK